MQRIAVILLAVLLILVFPAYAGDLDSSASPTDDSTRMYTLEQIYQAIASGTIAAKATGAFVEPETGPTPPTTDTHTLDEIYEKIGIKASPDPNVTTAGAADVTVGETFITRTGPDSGQAFVTGTREAAGGLPKTGQTTLYEVGDDGDIEAGWPGIGQEETGRFEPCGDANLCVKDNATGLIWAKDGNGVGCNGGVELLWSAAITWANGLSFDGYTEGWRLPNIKELMSIVDYGSSDPALDPVFTNTQPGNYWSSTTYVVNSGTAWYVNVYGGDVFGASKVSVPFYVRAVRGGQ